MKIAVIGSGIAGLSAAWFLGKKHDVSLYERWPRLGMDAHSVEIECDGHAVPINVPMRVFFPEYYPTLTALYRELDVAYEPIRYSGSFSEFGGNPYFRYRNYWIGGRTIPFLAGRSAWRPSALKLGLELLRFLKTPPPEKYRNQLDELSIADYLAAEGYSRSLAEGFLYPTFAGICTCSYASVKAYPASIILGYLHSGLLGSRVNKLTHGTQDVAERLAALASDIYLDTSLRAVRQQPTGVEVVDGEGHARHYDHAVIATQANHALKLLSQASGAETAALRGFRYEQSRVVVHRDKRLAPRSPAEWSPVNFLLSDEHDKPMASILLNRIHPRLGQHSPVFETWNPFREIDADDLLLEADLERPVVTAESLKSIDRLQALHDQPDRRIWFCGSYSRRGIPLLESAAASARDVADRLNGLNGLNSLQTASRGDRQTRSSTAA